MMSRFPVLAFLVVLYFVLISGCDTNVMEGDTNITVILGDGTRLDSLELGNDFPEGEQPEGDERFSAYMQFIRGPYELTHVVAAGSDDAPIPVSAPRSLEIERGYRNDFARLLVLDSGSSPSRGFCSASNGLIPTNSGAAESFDFALLWYPCQPMGFLSFDAVVSTSSQDRDILYLDAADASDRASISAFAAFLTAGGESIPGELTRLVFQKTSGACRLAAYCGVTD